MCGLAGILDLRGAPVERAELARMGASLRHRGPDDEGAWIGRGVGLTSLRLAVLDLTDAAHQPMASDDGKVVLAYNGELYNFRELRHELELAGRRFRSSGDTEVVLRAYEEWGPACVRRFDGMFAFAVWDEGRRELLLARDRFGIKPLYYAMHNGRVLFGSEIKALLEAGLAPAVCLDALVEYFTFQNVLSDLTLFDGVKLLAPGHTLVISADGPERLTQYWELTFEPDESLDAGTAASSIREAFDGAIQRQLVSDVPVGSFLSGGIDSASIVALACRRVPRLMTFTGGFDLGSVTGIELVFDERADAELVAGAFRTEHYEMVMHAGDMAWVLPELVWHLEDLRVGMSYQNHYIARLASKFVKVALAGAGGDELFAGYPWRYEQVARASSDGEFERRYYEYWQRLVPEKERRTFFTAQAHASLDRPWDVFRQVTAPSAGLDPVSRALHFESKTFLHGLLLVEDRVTMAHGLEARVPFLDNELVDVARRIPSRLKHADAFGKRALRDAMRDLLPRSIVEKRKQGFSPPDRSWYQGPTMSYIEEVLLDPRSLERGWFEPAQVRRVLDEHVGGRVNHRLLIWSLLCFEWWSRLFVDGEPRVSRSPSEARARRVS